MDKLIELIATKEEWLMTRILAYAVEHGYSQFTSTLLEPWRMSIDGLSQPMLAILRSGSQPLDFGPTDAYHDDLSTQFGILEAQRHRERGIDVTMFLGLMKYYRRAYLDLLAEGEMDETETAVARNFLLSFFDRVELGFISEWQAQRGEAQLQELQAANRRMTNEKNKFLTIFESLSDPVVMLDSNGRVDLINAAAAKLINSNQDRYYDYKTNAHESTPDPVIGSHIAFTIPWLQPELNNFLESSEESLQMEKPIYNGTNTAYFHIKFSRMLDISQKFTGVLITFADVTRRRMAEMRAWMSRDAAEAASRAKTTFLANMSHELRTPLNAMLGFAQLIENSGHLPPTQIENLNIIRQSGLHLLDLINQILDLSKVEAGKMYLQQTQFDLHQLLCAVQNLFSLRIAQKNLKFYFDLAPDVPQFVEADGLKLRQVLTNLLSNAVKFTQEGTVTLQVKLTGAVQNEIAQVHFEVVDTGPGIAVDELPHIFEAFVQTQAGLASHEGTGLGMAISSQFVQLLGGDLRVATVLGQGSRFWFAVPVRVLATVPAKHVLDQQRPLPLPATAPTYRILVVDDQPFNRLLVVKLLEPLGFVVREAANGQEAVAMAQAWRPHLVFMDMRMPVMDGYEASQLIKQCLGAETAVIAMTASVFETPETIRTNAGCDGLLTKPFQQSELVALLETHLGVNLTSKEPAPIALNGSVLS